jgi:molecular chaperone GrpE
VSGSRKIPVDRRDRDVPEETETSRPSEASEDGGSDETGLEEVPGGQSPSAEEELETLRRERDELRDEVLRRRADFENYRRRVERDRHTAAQEALTAVFREVLGTVDNLERALEAGGGPEELRKGVELTYRELLGVLEAHDVVAVAPTTGDTFDPNVHQALLHEPTPGVSDGAVAEVLRKGYSYGERLLRPALVKVAKSAEPGEQGGGGGEEH